MQILINQQELDFTLEDENYFADIYRSVTDWLIQSGMNIISVKLNDKNEIFTKMDTLMSVPVKKISKIEIEADKETDDHFALIEYFQIFIEALSTENEAVMKDLSLEYKYIEEVILSYIGENEDNKRIVDKMTKLINNEDRTEEIGKLLTYCSIVLLNSYKEQMFPKSELFATILLIESQLEDYSNISVMLQTGKSSDAYRLILQFIEYAQKMIRIINRLKVLHDDLILEGIIEEKSYENFFQDFTEVLSELVEAFENEDIIQIGDLMEYEIVPKLKTLIENIKNNNAG